jgi:4'-phosphopantetheinyl transferase
MIRALRIEGLRELGSAVAKPGTLVLYLADLDDHIDSGESVFPLYLSETDFRESERFKTQVLQQRFLASRYVLKRVLADLADRPADQLEIERPPGGKPFMRHVAFTFNLSHSHNQFALGLSGEGEIGVDIEVGLSLEVAQEVAGNVLGPEELDHWTTLPESEQADVFGRYWTLKEAILKATGEGLGRDPRELQVDVGEDGPRFLKIPAAYRPAGNWLLGFVDTGIPNAHLAYALRREKS